MRPVALLFAALAASPLIAAERPTPARAAEALAATPVTAEPAVLYGVFDDFCATHFGAEVEPLVYQRFGDDLGVMPVGDWIWASETSAVIAFETNLPATSRVRVVDGSGSEALDRYHYLHQHTLTGLTPDTTYRYVIEVEDERGKLVSLEQRELRTQAAGSAIALAGGRVEAPLVLDQPGATYLLTADLEAPGVAIEIVADDVTLDLGGHDVTFGVGAEVAVAAGISAHGDGDDRGRYLLDGVRIVNGGIIQGDGPALRANDSSERFTPLVVKGSNAEIAGLRIDYHGPQVWGVRFSHSSGRVDAHHLVLRDRGGVITNRHGAAVRALGFAKSQVEGANDFHLHHILVARTRQNGIGGACDVSHNEIYLDSCSTNSFAVQTLSRPGVAAGEHHHNRIFGTGFNPYGFGWAHEDMTLRDNLVHFHGLMVNHRWEGTEDWGDLSTLEGMRVTNYGKGGQVRNNLVYRDNLIVLVGSGGCELRGTGFFSDTSIDGLVFERNVVKVLALDAATTQVACIAAHGHTNKPDSLPVVYRDNVLIANRCHVRFGDSYGKGHNHHLIGNELIRIGEVADYHAVALGGGYTTAGHRFIDTQLGAGVSLEDPYWQKTSSKSGYAVGWTVAVTAPAGAQVSIQDTTGGTAFDGTVPDSGRVELPLIQHHVHPPTWPQGGEAAGISGAVLETLSPYTVTVTADGTPTTRTIAVDRPGIELAF